MTVSVSYILKKSGMTYLCYDLSTNLIVLGGIMVSVLATGHKVRGFNIGRG
jgi:hypothetical protein